MIEVLLKGGRVIDPSQSLDTQMDLAIQDGSIAQIAPNLKCNEAKRIIDVTGKIVVPGLIDLHCHIYEGVNQTGVNPDITGVSVLEETTGRWVFHDAEDNTLKGDTALTPVLIIKDGEIFSPDWGPHPWRWLPESEDYEL